MSEPQSSPEPERRTGDRRSEPGPTRRGDEQGFSSRWLGIAGRDLAIVGGALVAIVAAFSLTRPIFTHQTKLGQAITGQAQSVAPTPELEPPTTTPKPGPTDTSRIAQMVKTPQFEADRRAFAADLVATGRVDSLRADSIAYYAVRESYVQGIPPAVVFGVMLTENARLISGAMSDVGAVGLMQVYPKIWLKELSAKFGKDLATDSTNLKYGIYILKQYIKTDSGRVKMADIGKGLLRYNGCVVGRHTPNCKNYPTKVQNFVERQAESICGDKSFSDCIAKPFLAGLLGRREQPASTGPPS
jgi:hypothetical protein